MTSSSYSHVQGNEQAPLRSSSIAHTATLFEGAFWGPRLQTLREQTLPMIYQQMQQDGHFTAFREDWHAGMHPIPYVFWESDIAKWIEATSYSLATHPDAQLEACVDEAIAFMLTLQQPDGYLNLWFTQVEPEKRWTNLRDYHELYCAGHLIEAAVAHFQATGKRVLLDAVCRYADYIDATFGLDEGKRHGYCGHEEIAFLKTMPRRASLSRLGVWTCGFPACSTRQSPNVPCLAGRSKPWTRPRSKPCPVSSRLCCCPMR